MIYKKQKCDPTAKLFEPVLVAFHNLMQVYDCNLVNKT